MVASLSEEQVVLVRFEPSGPILRDWQIGYALVLHTSQRGSIPLLRTTALSFNEQDSELLIRLSGFDSQWGLQFSVVRWCNGSTHGR